MGKAFTLEEKVIIKKRILEIGEKLFIEKGIKKTGLQEITKEAGIALGSFYNFFESKEKLFLELLDIYNARIFEIQKEVLDRQIKVGKIDMEELVNVTFDTYQKMPGYMMIFEKNEEYDYLLSKISEEEKNTILSKDKEVLAYFLGVLETQGYYVEKRGVEIVEGILQHMFIGLVNRYIIGPIEVVDEILKVNAKIIAKYLKNK